MGTSNVNAEIYAVNPEISILNRYASRTDSNGCMSLYLVITSTIAKPGIKKQSAMLADQLNYLLYTNVIPIGKDMEILIVTKRGN